jgi:hypothetical protein
MMMALTIIQAMPYQLLLMQMNESVRRRLQALPIRRKRFDSPPPA